MPATACSTGWPQRASFPPTSGMATHRVRIAAAGELDEELLGWLREAYERA